MDCLSLELVASLAGHQDRVWSVAWSPKGDFLASCSGDKTVRIWTRRAGATSPPAAAAPSAATITGNDSVNPTTCAGSNTIIGAQQQWYCCAILDQCHSRTIRNIAWSPNGKALATASFDATVAIWELAGSVWEQVAELEGHENEVKCVTWNPDGRLIATCGRDRSVWIWESLPGREFECVDVKQGHTQDVKAVRWHPAGELLVSASYDDTIKLWNYDGDEWVCSQTLGGCGPGSGHSSTVWDVSWDPDGQRLASCSDDLTIKLWESRAAGAAPGPGRLAVSGGSGGYGGGGGLVPSRPDLRCGTTLSGYHGRTIFSLDWGPTGLIASGDGEDCICVFGQGDPEMARVVLRASEEEARQGPAGTNTSSVSCDGGDERRGGGGGSGGGDTTEVDPDDGSGASGPDADAGVSALRDDGKERLGKGSTGLRPGQEGQPWGLWTRVQSAHDADVNCVRWNPAHPRLLASCSDDRLVKLWWLR
ncbi:hypothetical protein Vretimale_11666 [Volvox reticuliferus]|uniref:Probable cytosolic iron-sulfur protein assembly protein CIAO1 homolog n=2 Tax=Volvox reticuliferus TaxID=1737510 RepID=A0A8J4LR62_9CHLO|nr:hypothetical protein Vretimale_11666 [Volvox reticuliferus]